MTGSTPSRPHGSVGLDDQSLPATGNAGDLRRLPGVDLYPDRLHMAA